MGGGYLADFSIAARYVVVVLRVVDENSKQEMGFWEKVVGWVDAGRPLCDGPVFGYVKFDSAFGNPFLGFWGKFGISKEKNIREEGIFGGWVS